jgi:UDP-glucose 4-epimerase
MKTAMKTNKIKILILGADGFIGSNLVKSLQDDNKYRIFAFDLFKDGISKNIPSFDDDLVMVQGNFLNINDLRNALKGIDYVFHFISLTTPGSSMNDPLIDVNTNLAGTINLLEECVKAKIKRVIFPSSGGAVYGDQKAKICNEESATDPVSPYAITKLTIEKYLYYYKIHHGLDYLILRYANPYGPGQNVVGSQGIISISLNNISNNRPVVIFGDGENVRDYIYIDDLIEMTKLLFIKNTKHKIYNIGSGEGKTINELMSVIKKIVEKDIVTDKRPDRLVDVRRIILDTRRVSSEISYVPQTSLESGIKKTWDWLIDSN